jgi:L-ascorbate metabolism protein UlaG (beta-lactamase superfamily)
MLYRGTVFRAMHDSSYPFWRDGEPPREKFGVVFNVEPVSHGDVHYFLTSSKIWKYQDVLSDVLILPVGSYDFFPEETLIDFRYLRIVPLAKLESHGMDPKGPLTMDDVYRCMEIAAKVKPLGRPDKRLLGLR